MDPLSFTASIIAVNTAVKAGVKGFRKLSDYRKAPQEIGDLVSELESTGSLLEEILGFAGVHEDCEGLRYCVERAETKTTEINDLLLSASFVYPQLNNANQARLVLFRYRDRLKSLRDGLIVIRLDLAVRLNLIQAKAFRSFASRIDSVGGSSCGIEGSLGDVRCAQDKPPATFRRLMQGCPANQITSAFQSDLARAHHPRQHPRDTRSHRQSTRDI